MCNEICDVFMSEVYPPLPKVVPYDDHRIPQGIDMVIAYLE